MEMAEEWDRERLNEAAAIRLAQQFLLWFRHREEGGGERDTHEFE